MIRYILTIFIDWMNCHHEVFHCLGIAHLYFNFSYLTFIYCLFSCSDIITYIIYIRYINFLFTLGTIPLRNFKLPLFILFSSIIILILSNTHFFFGLLQGVLQMRNAIGLL